MESLTKDKKPLFFFISFSLILLFSILFITATTSISDLEVRSPRGVYENITNVSFIEVSNKTLIFFDTLGSRTVALFNAGPGEIESTAAAIGIMGGFERSSGFIGDVDNFDDVNAQSRFRETNLNNGTSASAAFVTRNDLGFTTAFGIGSSNFQFSGESFNSEGVVFHNAPTRFNYANGGFFGWNWIANNGNSTNFNFTETMQLSPGGNLNLLGNFTGNQHYGELSFYDPLSPETITLSTANVFENITSLSSGDMNGFNQLGDGLVTLIPGLYSVDFSVSYSDTAGNAHIFSILLDNLQIEKISSMGFTPTATSISNPSATGLVRLEKNDMINLAVADVAAPVKNVDILMANINLVRVGD